MTDAMIQIALALLGGGSVGAILSYLQARRRAPVERDSAHAAASREITEAATELMAPLRHEVERLDREVAKARQEASEARQEAAAARREAESLRRITTEADDYITRLHRDWLALREEERPPAWRWMD